MNRSAACRRTDQPSLTDTSSVPHTCIKFFGHIARADQSIDRSRALGFSVVPLPSDWSRRSGRPRHTWLRAVESDLAAFSSGSATAYINEWRALVGTTTSTGHWTSRVMMMVNP